MQDATQVLGRIPYSPQLILPGNYTGVIKELQEALPNNPIEVFYRPPNGASSPNISLRLPSIELPSGFAAIVYPHYIYPSKTQSGITPFGDPGYLRVSSLWLNHGPVISSHRYYYPEEERQRNIDALMQEYDPANVILNGIELRRPSGQFIFDGSKFEELINILSSAGFNPKSLSSTYTTTQYPVGDRPRITEAGLDFSKEGIVSGIKIPHNATLYLKYNDKDTYDEAYLDELNRAIEGNNKLHISISSDLSIQSLTELDEQTVRRAMALHEPDLMTLEGICALFKI
ncbi:MAG: hypothetical protein AAB969_00555 [Patescibacteria group bacterium]